MRGCFRKDLSSLHLILEARQLVFRFWWIRDEFIKPYTVSSQVARQKMSFSNGKKSFFAAEVMQMFEIIIALSFAFFSVTELKLPAMRAISLETKALSLAKCSLVLSLRSLK